MRLKKLIEGLCLEYRGGKQEVEVTGLTSNSKHTFFGNLFIAKRGCQECYIEEAIANGAKVVVTEIYNPFLPEQIIQLLTKEIALVEKELATRFYQEPSKQLCVFGITGTNGKTTTSYLIKHLADGLGKPCGLVGTNEYLIYDRHLPSYMTTPDLLTNQKLLREMVKTECQAAVLEVSSHGLDQGRVDLIDFDVAIFTNLSQDHLDYHANMEEYFLAKSRLFSHLEPTKWAILPFEDPLTKRLQELTQAQILTYGLSVEADLYATDLICSLRGTQATLHFKEETESLTFPLIGKFNLLNGLAAAGALLSQGFSLKECLCLLATFGSVAGRLESVENDLGVHIFVDYAHTPDALENILHLLSSLKEEGKLITVFGCGGQRDRTKRPMMGQVAARFSDEIVITSDNPRKEDPLSICEQIAKGCLDSAFEIELDRRKAIEKALEVASEGDIVLIAGKGHEGSQIFSHQTVAFDDKNVVQEVIRNLTPVH